MISLLIFYIISMTLNMWFLLKGKYPKETVGLFTILGPISWILGLIYITWAILADVDGW